MRILRADRPAEFTQVDIETSSERNPDHRPQEELICTVLKEAREWTCPRPSTA